MGERQIPCHGPTATVLKGALGGARRLSDSARRSPACGGSDSGGGTTSGGKAVVRMWSWYSDQEDQFPKLIEKFEAAHSNIKIENRIFGTPDQYLPALQAAVAGGDVPEIFAPHTRALTYGTGGISADLKKDLGDDFLKDFFDSANQEYTLDGKQYAVGWMAQTFGLFYNPDLLKKAGVGEDEIETWDDLIAAAREDPGHRQAPGGAQLQPDDQLAGLLPAAASPRSPTIRPSTSSSTS